MAMISPKKLVGLKRHVTCALIGVEKGIELKYYFNFFLINKWLNSIDSFKVLIINLHTE